MTLEIEPLVTFVSHNKCIVQLWCGFRFYRDCFVELTTKRENIVTRERRMTDAGNDAVTELKYICLRNLDKGKHHWVCRNHSGNII